MVLGSFFLTPATALRYEKHDRKVRQLSNEEALGIRKGGRKVDMREEYYVSFYKFACGLRPSIHMARNWLPKIWIIGNKGE